MPERYHDTEHKNQEQRNKEVVGENMTKMTKIVTNDYCGWTASVIERVRAELRGS